jgi:hypothetical protein
MSFDHRGGWAIRVDLQSDWGERMVWNGIIRIWICGGLLLMDISKW